MDSNYTIHSKHFCHLNLSAERLLILFYRDHPSLKGCDILFAFLSDDDSPSILVFDYDEDKIDEYYFLSYELISSHTQAGLASIKLTTSFFQGSIFIPKIERMGIPRVFRYTFHFISPQGKEETCVSLWDDVDNPQSIKLTDRIMNQFSIFPVENQLDLYGYLFQCYDFTITGYDFPDNVIFTNKGNRIEITYNRCDLVSMNTGSDPIYDSKLNTSFTVNYDNLIDVRQTIEQSIKVMTIILKEVDIYKIKAHLEKKQAFLRWLDTSPLTFSQKE